MKKILFTIFYTFTLLYFYTFVAHAQTFSCTYDSFTGSWKNTSECPDNTIPISQYDELSACSIFSDSSFNPPVNGTVSGNYSLPCFAIDKSTGGLQSSDRQADVSPTTSPSPTSRTIKDCTEDGGVCRLQSLGCQTGFLGRTSNECKSQNSGGATYMCCMPGVSDSGQIDPGGYASLSDSQCVGRGLADYMNAVIAGAGNIPNVKLLSPAFNMTSVTFDEIVNGMGQSGAKFGELDGIAGNVYNVENRRITSWLTEKLANPYVSGKPVFITETGEKDFADGRIDLDEAKIRLKPELDLLRTVGNQWNVQASLLFNGLGANSGFSSFQWSTEALKDLCGGYSCGPVGINQASFFSQSDTRYAIMRDLNMQYDLEIATAGNSESVIRAVNSLPGGNIIVRIGVGDDSGGFTDPQKYVEFIKAVASQTSNTVYFIAGPNEPDSEYWVTPACLTTQLKGKNGPLEEGFTPVTIDCNATKEPNYHPLRPYPGNPCDPLIARSIPEAPVSPEKKFNTFACGTSLTPSAIERFDPYGKNGAYENLPLVEGYAHTVCEPREGTPEFDAIARSGGTVTCWRTSAFDITVDLSHANVGILGNTQDNSLTDAQKVNEYLSWYLTGTPQIGDQIPLNKNKPADIDQLINFSGPLRKLLPFDAQTTLKETLSGTNDKEVHNYIAGENLFGLDTVRLDRYSRFGGVLNETFLRKIFQNVPLSSMEDTTGEFTMSVFRDPSFDQQVDSIDSPQYSSVVQKNTAPLQLYIKSAQTATK